jgi:hypothetical protein
VAARPWRKQADRGRAQLGRTVDEGGERVGRGGVEERRQRQFGAKVFVDEQEHAHRSERGTANVEEVIVWAQRGDPEHALPDGPDARFGRLLSRGVGPRCRLTQLLFGLGDGLADVVDGVGVA